MWPPFFTRKPPWNVTINSRRNLKIFDSQKRPFEILNGKKLFEHVFGVAPEILTFLTQNNLNLIFELRKAGPSSQKDEFSGPYVYPNGKNRKIDIFDPKIGLSN